MCNDIIVIDTGWTLMWHKWKLQPLAAIGGRVVMIKLAVLPCYMKNLAAATEE